MSNENRAGRYVLQPSGYKAFVPTRLNPPPNVDLAPLLSKISQADREIGRLDSVLELVPDAETVVRWYAKKDAILSSQIEGLHTTFADFVQIEANIEKADSASDHSEVRNYLDAIYYGIERKEDLPLSLRLLKEVHEILLKDVRGSEREPGEFRRTQNWIGSEGCTLSTAIFIPPAVEDMKTALFDLEDFFYADYTLPPLIRIAFIHAQFETIHPFLDGNGRVGRLLITFLLVHWRILEKPLLYPSLVMRINRDEYYLRLQSIRDHGDWENWFSFFLDCIIISAKDAYLRSKMILRIKQDLEAFVQTNFPRAATTYVKAIQIFFERIIVDSKILQATLDCSPGTAISILNQLEQHDVIRQVGKRQRNRVYYLWEYFEVLDQEVILPKESQPSLFSQ